MNNYNDIINMPHHESTVHKRMPTINRAAQFSPFAALTGYEEAIEETGRITKQKQEIDEYLKSEINSKLIFLSENNSVTAKITYYVPDSKKEGGEYVMKKGAITKLDSNKKTVMVNGTEIKIDDISDVILIDSDEFF